MNITRGSGGFTLVEVLVAGMLLVLVSGAVLGLYTTAIYTWQVQTKTHDTREHLRVGMDRLTRELRQATQLTKATESLIEFKLPDGKTVKTVEYKFDAQKKQLNRRVLSSGASKPVSSFITGVSFVYGPENVAVGEISWVTITLTGACGSEPPIILRSGISLRVP
jgi:Tfp pilus assembly protein PilW